MGSFLFSAKYDRSPSPRRERNSDAGNCPLIRARLSNHPIASARGFLTAPLARRILLPIGGEYIQCRGDLPVLHKNRATAASPLPAAKRALAREIVRSSARGFRIISQLSAPGFLTAPLARRSLLPISGEYIQRRGDFPVLHKNRATAASPLPAAKRALAREIVRSSARGFRIISQLSAPGFLTAPLARRIFFSAATNTGRAGETSQFFTKIERQPQPLSPPRKKLRRGKLSAHPRAAFESYHSFLRRAF